MRTWQSMNMGDEFEVESGAEQVVAHLRQDSAGTLLSALPFVSVSWNNGDSKLRYRMATAVPGIQARTDGEAGTWLPAVSVRHGSLALEHGMHQEVSWERNTDASSVAVLLYSDTLSNPILEAMTHLAGSSAAIANDALFDPASGLLRAAGPAYASTGVVASVERRAQNGNSIRLSYANGNALVLPAVQRAMPLAQLVAAARPRRAQMYSISLSGTLDGSGTRWRASYRWQPEDTVTRVATFMADAAEPYLNLHLRQPICHRAEGLRGLDAMLDMRNLLSQGGRSYVLSDGSLLLFAQDQRSISAGLAFTF